MKNQRGEKRDCLIIALSGSLHSRVEIKAVDVNGILREDILFKSPSYASAFVIGSHTNGLTYWKTADGKMLKEIEKNEE